MASSKLRRNLPCHSPNMFQISQSPLVFHRLLVPNADMKIHLGFTVDSNYIAFHFVYHHQLTCIQKRDTSYSISSKWLRSVVFQA